MAKKPARQKQYVLGAEYQVIGPSGKERTLVLRGRLRLRGKTFLVFGPKRANAKPENDQ